MKYARYTDDIYTHKENYTQVVERVIDMFKAQIIKKGGSLGDFESAFESIRSGLILPSMRAMQFAGGAIERNNQRIFNCTYKAVEEVIDISDIFYMLLCGCGVGYSVRRVHINKLPMCVKGVRNKTSNINITYVIEDTIEGWAEAVKILLNSYLSMDINIEFDYSQIRPAGSILKTTGGLAPGPEPLRIALDKVRGILDTLTPYKKLTPLQVSDIICILAHCVLSGGNRRSALIALFDWDDEEMKRCKHGEWFNEHVYRSRANFSAMPTYVNNEGVELSYDEFKEFMRLSLEEGYGEPAFIFTNCLESSMGLNPCSEIGLIDGGGCNLTEINANKVKSKNEFIKACRHSAIIGTLQATFTDFSYVSKKWKEACEKDALLGCSITGLQTSEYFNSLKVSGELNTVLETGAKEIVKTNKDYAKKLNINPAKRLTTIKPAGSTSCIFGCSSGIHPAYSEYFIRRVRISKISGVYKMIKELTPSLIEDALDNPQFDAVVSIPVHMKTPDGRYTKDIGAIEQLNEAVEYTKSWILPGHIDGVDTHNVSLTIHYKPDEKEELIQQLYLKRNILRCVSVFPLSEGKYPQQPFEKITREVYLEMEAEANKLESIFDVVCETDFVPIDFSGACDGGACELKL